MSCGGTIAGNVLTLVTGTAAQYYAQRRDRQSPHIVLLFLYMMPDRLAVHLVQSYTYTTGIPMHWQSICLTIRLIFGELASIASEIVPRIGLLVDLMQEGCEGMPQNTPIECPMSP